MQRPLALGVACLGAQCPGHACPDGRVKRSGAQSRLRQYAALTAL